MRKLVVCSGLAALLGARAATSAASGSCVGSRKREACPGAHGDMLEMMMTPQAESCRRTDVVAGRRTVPSGKIRKELCHSPKSPFVPPRNSFDFTAQERHKAQEHLPWSTRTTDGGLG